MNKQLSRIDLILKRCKYQAHSLEFNIVKLFAPTRGSQTLHEPDSTIRFAIDTLENSHGSLFEIPMPEKSFLIW